MVRIICFFIFISFLKSRILRRAAKNLYYGTIKWVNREVKWEWTFSIRYHFKRDFKSITPFDQSKRVEVSLNKKRQILKYALLGVAYLT